MSKSYNQKLKLLYLVKILERETDENHPLSASALIKELENYGISAERKSIYDDIAYLQDFGYDIILNPSRRDGGYYMASREFELPELKILVDTVQTSRFITATKSKELIAKLEAMANKFDEKELKRQVYVNNRVKTDNESIYYTVNDIYHAIQNNHQIEFIYFYWNTKKQKVPRRDGKTYKVSPWTLAYSDGNYYLVAYDKEADEIRHYRVDKMKNVIESDENREGNDKYKSFDLVAYQKRTFNMYAGRDEAVNIILPSNMVGIFIDRFGDDLTIYGESDGRCEVRVNVAISSQFFGYLAGLGKDVYIKSPESVREEYKQYIGEILKSMD